MPLTAIVKYSKMALECTPDVTLRSITGPCAYLSLQRNGLFPVLCSLTIFLLCLLLPLLYHCMHTQPLAIHAILTNWIVLGVELVKTVECIAILHTEYKIYVYYMGYSSWRGLLRSYLRAVENWGKVWYVF